MKTIQLSISKNLTGVFKSACSNKMLECNIGKELSPGNACVWVEVFRRSGKDISPQILFELGQIYNDMSIDYYAA